MGVGGKNPNACLFACLWANMWSWPWSGFSKAEDCHEKEWFSRCFKHFKGS